MTEAAVNDPMLPVPFRVVEREFHRPDCTMLVVRPADGKSACTFEPGQFYMLYAFGHGEVPVSVNGDPVLGHSLTFTIKEVGSVTSALCALAPGAMLGLRGPFGNTWPVEAVKGRDIIIMAGGLGCAPLRPVIYHLLAQRKDYGRISLLYGAKKPETFLFNRELQEWKERINVILTVDHGTPEWRGPVGLVTELVKTLDINPDNTSAMLCGPEKMIQFSAEALLARGIKAPHIHVSMERNMKCAIGHCGRCQFGPYFICKDGPVFSFDRVEPLLKIGEV